MRPWHLIPLALILLVVVGLPVAAFTNTGLEHDLRKDLGISTGECEPETNLASQWTTAASLPYKLDEPRGTTLGGEVYLVGGITGLQQLPGGDLLLEASKELTRFDPRAETYEELASPPRRMNHIGVVTYRHDLYVLGGYGRRRDHDTSSAFFRYDPRSNTWSRMPDMPEPRAAMAAGVIGRQLIVAGGARDNVPKSDAYSFDFRTGRWSRLPSMLSRREHVGATTVGDRLYVLGGRGPDTLAATVAEAYDVSERRWTQLPPMPTATGGLGAVSIDGKAIAVGGGNDGAGTVTGAVQEWDPEDEEWSLLPEMRTPRHGHATAAVGNRIWVFGGSPCAYFNATDSAESLELEPSG
jgi:non-specific serine/threonine protein kinase